MWASDEGRLGFQAGAAGRGGSFHVWAPRWVLLVVPGALTDAGRRGSFLLCTPAIWNGRPFAGGSLDCLLQRWGGPRAPFIQVGYQRPGSTSFNPSLSEEVHAPLQPAPLARSPVPGFPWPIAEFGGCVGPEPFPTLRASLLRPPTCRLWGLQPCPRSPGRSLLLSRNPLGESRAQRSLVFRAPRLGQTLPEETSTCQGSGGGILRSVTLSLGHPRSSQLQCPRGHLQSPEERERGFPPRRLPGAAPSTKATPSQARHRRGQSVGFCRITWTPEVGSQNQVPHPARILPPEPVSFQRLITWLCAQATSLCVEKQVGTGPWGTLEGRLQFHTKVSLSGPARPLPAAEIAWGDR